MPIDSNQIGNFAMQFMDQLTEKYGEDAELQVLLVVAAVNTEEAPKLEIRTMSGDGGTVPSWTIKGIASTVANEW